MININHHLSPSTLGLFLMLLATASMAHNNVVVIPMSGDDLKPLANIVTVAKQNGDFTDPTVAMASITDARIDNPYLVVIAPGVYPISSTVIMQEFVDIAGSGENVTKLTGGITGNFDATSAIVSGANNASIRDLSIESTGGGNHSFAIYNGNASPRLINISATASGATDSFAIFNNLSSPDMQNITAIASGSSVNYAVFNLSSSPKMFNISARASKGSINIGVINNGSLRVEMHNVDATASSGTNNYGVWNQMTGTPPYMNNVAANASGGTNNFGVYNQSSSPDINNVTATASGGAGTNYGIYNFMSSSPNVRQSQFSGDTEGVYNDGVTTSPVFGHSSIVGGVSENDASSSTCIYVDGGSGAALDASCQP